MVIFDRDDPNADMETAILSAIIKGEIRRVEQDAEPDLLNITSSSTNTAATSLSSGGEILSLSAIAMMS